ncbi:MAG: ArsR family transcriptional regulator [Nitrospirae bacterium]|nr:MAG: ArsR family transcriptional regulator [Nitrospirota bacterium]
MKVRSRPADCVEQLKVLADTTRLAVLELLLRKPWRVGELRRALGIEQSLLSHHLALLREAGFVDTIRQGKTILYRLAPGMACTSSGKGLDLGCCQLTFSRTRRR